MIDDISPPGSWVRELSARPHTYRDVWAALREAEARLAKVEAELETERMRLAACGVVAMANTPETAAEARKMHPDYWCASVADVARIVDAEMAARAERDALRADAERYRWLRPRLEVRNTEAVSGDRRPALETRIGQSFFDTPTRGSAGYTNPSRFDRECETLDAAIDAARGGA